MTETLLVTGGAGFIGSALVRHLVAHTGWRVVTVDKLTYAGHPESLGEVLTHPRHTLERVDIADAADLARIFAQYAPAAVLHLAAESHVDRSIDGSAPFIQTNIVGTYQLLEAARVYWRLLPAAERAAFRFLHVSTDEVFGSVGPGGSSTEASAYAPSSPYSASKAAADHLVRAWHHTYALPVLLTNSANNFGPCQLPEKLIPRTIMRALAGLPLELYGDGGHVRDWLYVDDHVRALALVLDRGRVGESYNVGGGCELTNRHVVGAVCELLDELAPAPTRYAELISFVVDRPGHDRRYALAASRIMAELGWAPRESFASGLRKTVRWYLENRDWCERVAGGSYPRLGTLG